jgi:hypothetical protein
MRNIRLPGLLLTQNRSGKKRSDRKLDAPKREPRSRLRNATLNPAPIAQRGVTMSRADHTQNSNARNLVRACFTEVR